MVPRRPASRPSAVAGAPSLLFLVLCFSCVLDVPARAAGPRYEERWVYCAANLQVEQSANDVIALLERAKKDGYTALMLADYKLQVLYRVPDSYFRNVARVKAAADRAGIELVPAVFSIGYSNGHLASDPNLAEGLPVVDQPFIVRATSEPGDGASSLEAVLDTSNAVPFRNGGLEEFKGERFSGFSMQDDPGTTTHIDRRVVHGGGASCRFEPGNRGAGRTTPNVRLMQRVALRPLTCYRFSCWAKTKGLGRPGAFRMLALGADRSGRPLTFQEGLLQADQDWKRIDVVFNSLDQPAVNLYIGLWGEGPGTLWADDIQIEELPLVNVLRRSGCPLTVQSADGKTAYREGRDFGRVVDPKLGMVPWAGEYEFDHPGARITIPRGSRIRKGERLLVSWYHPVITAGGQVMCCLSEPALDAVLLDQARRVNELFHPRTFFMSHDEIRVANWCAACRKRAMTPGQMLADNVRKCQAVLKSVNPEARIVVWSDMFDPHHNAVDRYYLVNGPLGGSWEGLARDTIVANWNSGKARESLQFFDGRGHRQIIAGYYDGDDLTNFQNWDEATRGVKGVFGFMYTTWSRKYEMLGPYGAAIGRAERP